MTQDSNALCTYSVGDPFNADDPERQCGKTAVKRVNWSSINEAWATIWYCRRHWTVASQVIQPGVTVEDLTQWDQDAEAC